MIRTLQSLRFFFIILVVLSHYIGSSFDFGGECGVSFFFMLSGFVLSLAYSERITKGLFSTTPFVVKQWIKIYPLHILTFIVMFALDIRLEKYCDITAVIANILLLQSWVPADSFYFVANSPSWFLCDILFFYVVFSSLNKYILRSDNRKLLAISLVVILLYICLMAVLPTYLVNPILYANPLTRLLDFIVGIILYKLYVSDNGIALRDKLNGKSFLTVSLMELSVILLVVITAILYPHLPQRVRTVSIFWLAIPLFIFFFAMTDKHSGVISRFLQGKTMLWLGNISFSIYIIHAPVLRIFNSISVHTGIADPTLVHFILFITILILFSHITNKLNIALISRIGSIIVFTKSLNNIYSSASLKLLRFCFIISLLYGITFLLAEFYDNPFSSFHDFIILALQWLAIEIAIFGLIYIISINKYVFCVLFPIITVLSTIIAYYRCTLHLTLMPEVIELLLENDLRTSMDVVSWQLVLWIMLALVVSVFISMKRFRMENIPCQWLHLTVSLIIVMVPLNVGTTNNAIVKRIPYSIFFTIAEYLDNRISVETVRQDFKGSAVCNTDSMTVVFIIGESLRASSMQVNGYERATTPLLCKEKNAVSMSNIYSDYNLTHLSIPHFMTRSDEKHPDRAYNERSFISLMKRAGYSTAWLANQESIKSFVYFIKECDRVKYVSSGKVSYIYEKWLDTDLLPYYDEELQRPAARKLIILHTVGSHWYYNTHFTDEYEKFKPITDSKIISSNSFEQIRNSYDNSILFSDYFWNQVINRLRNRNAVLIYLSDHGECMGEDGHFIHGSVDNEPQHLPGCFIWYSDEYARRYPQKVKALRSNKDKRYKSYFLFHSILDAADIKSGYINNSMNIFRYQ